MRPDELGGPKFLLYHDMLRPAGGDERRARDSFARHFSAVAASSRRFVSMSDFMTGEPLDPRDVVVTVDDGARSFVTCMLPVLREHGASATLFVASGLMGREGDGIGFLDWDEASALAAEGIEFGGHGVTHVPLDQIERDAMRREIAESAEAMRAHGLAPVAFAYPFGRYDEEVKRAVREAGYPAAFTVMKGGGDAFEIRRRLFAGDEGELMTRFVMGERFFEIREAARRVVPRRLLKQEQPIAPERWGAAHFGVRGSGTGEPRQ
jgi:peptidoglycan/xylan/chitin deacetylase (PgdA/CDA1 family)